MNGKKTLQTDRKTATRGEPTKRRLRASAKHATKPANAVKDDRLELLFTIVNRSKAEYYVDLLHSFDVNMQVVLLGHGTADANMMAYFGLDDLSKAVILGVVNETKLNKLLPAIEDKFAKIKNGKGIAYTVPLDGVIGTLIYGFLSDNRRAVKDNAANKENKA